jgi:hypothetical protein
MKEVGARRDIEASVGKGEVARVGTQDAPAARERGNASEHAGRDVDADGLRKLRDALSERRSTAPVPVATSRKRSAARGSASSSAAWSAGRSNASWRS